MSRKKELQRQLGSRYSYARLLSDREIQKLRRRIPDDFSEAVAASLTVGCLRLHAVLYRSRDTLLLGYDVFVKDDPDAPEWIYYDSLPDTAGLQETQMLRVLDGMAQAQGLSYTECCFDRLNGKLPQKPPCAP